MNDILIRQVTEKDLLFCTEIEGLCFEPSEAASYEKIFSRQQQYAAGFLIAELKGKVIGFINCGATNSPDLTDEEFKAMVGHDDLGKNLVIFSLAVHPDFQKKGVAKQLLTVFIARSIEQNKSTLLLLCKSSLVSFYEDRGFINDGSSNSEHGGFSWWEMSKQLTNT